MVCGVVVSVRTKTDKRVFIFDNGFFFRVALCWETV